MRESRTYGSVRGALSNERPYRVPLSNVGSWHEQASQSCCWRVCLLLRTVGTLGVASQPCPIETFLGYAR
jgi:hypothetical protein